MKAIGGYFSLETKACNNMPHQDGILVNSGRNALEYVLRSIPVISKIYIPFFTCDTVLEPVDKLGLKCEFYHVDGNLEISGELELHENEYLVYTDYFGIKDQYVKELVRRYSDRLIVDNAQALYSEATGKCVYSPRKFVGVPDGGIAYVDSPLLTDMEKDVSYDRCSHLLKRIDLGAEKGYSDFRENSMKIKGQPIREMSALTELLLGGIDFKQVKEKRNENFNYLHERLSAKNQLRIPDLKSFVCPMVYPFMIEGAESLRKEMIENRIFVATYWPNVLTGCDEKQLEYRLAKNILPLPIDQRYGKQEMDRILSFIEKNNK